MIDEKGRQDLVRTIHELQRRIDVLERRFDAGEISAEQYGEELDLLERKLERFYDAVERLDQR